MAKFAQYCLLFEITVASPRRILSALFLSNLPQTIEEERFFDAEYFAAGCWARVSSVVVPLPSAPLPPGLCLFRDFETIVDVRRIAEQLTRSKRLPDARGGCQLASWWIRRDSKGCCAAPRQRVKCRGRNQSRFTLRSRSGGHKSLVYRVAGLQTSSP